MLLTLRNVTKSYERKSGPAVIVGGFNLEIPEHEFVCLIGHSGCGKTTVLSMIAGLLRITSGEIILDDWPIQGPGPDRGLVSQSCGLLPNLTAFGNVMLGADQVYPHSPRRERVELASYYLNQVGLRDHFRRYPARLSEGMRQRVSVARAFALSPRLLLLDEPFGLLDTLTRFELQRVLLSVRRHSKTTTFMVTHDIDEALYLADRIVVMTRGPAAQVGDIVRVPFASPRDRRSLLEDEEYYKLREHLMDLLESCD
jgi:nitrate/nitrite transport system ATP-binding protein